MEKKCLFILMGILVLLSISSSVYAIGDSLGDQRVGGYDIKSADVLFYPPSSWIDNTPPDLVKITLEMNTGNNLPGIVVFEFDVDNDTATGGSVSIPCFFNTCADGTLLKPVVPGIDIAIIMILREQGSDVSTAWCYNCTGTNGLCFLRNTPCYGCGTSNCYKGLSICPPGSPNCFLARIECRNLPYPQCDYCYEMSTTCSGTTPCGLGRVIGEWYAIANPSLVGIGVPPVERGRLYPLPKGTNTAIKDSYRLPWELIVQGALNAGANFDPYKANDPNYCRWQVSTWIDPDYATTKNDLINFSAYCVEVTDVVPNYLSAAATLGNEICRANIDGDGDVDPADLMIFRSECCRKNCP